MYAPRRSIRKAGLALLGLALFAAAAPSFADDDPPDRVARLSYLRGDVSFQPAGDEDWVQASLNRPLATGDKLYTDHDSRVELEVGAATLRLDAQSSFDILNLDDNVAQAELTEGVMNLHVRRVLEGQTYEVDTPTLAFVINQPGDYRVDIAPDGSSTMVTVFNGAGDVYGENNASYSVRSGQSYRFHDSGLQDYEVLDMPRGDDFDNWVQSRNDRYERSPTRQYVSEDVIGYADLDDNGSWNDEPEYGHVWYPTTVEADWTPYRYGHWSWIDPWGWSWVDNASWGFAPFHYGRWVYTSNRWGWCPGRREVRPIYAPALVAFVGGGGWSVGINSGGPVGWFPLGPRDVYVPWYHASRNYFTNVNVRNTTVINNTYITNVYNNYSRGQPITNVNYAYRQNERAVTAVSRDAFVGARAVNASRVQINQAQLRNANVVSRVGIPPSRQSFVAANAARARAVPNAQTLNRGVIARTQPPPRPAPVQNRIAAIQRNNAQPLPTTQLRQIATRANPATPAAGNNPANRAMPQRVQVVGNNATKPQPIPARAPGANPTTRPGQPAAPNTRVPTPATPNGRVPTPSEPNNGRPTPNTNPAMPNGRPPVTRTPNTPNNPANTANPREGMPSSRFAPHTNAPGTPGSPRTATPPTRTAPNDNAPNRATPNTPNRVTTPNTPNRVTTPNTPTRTTPTQTPRQVPNENAGPRGRTISPADDDRRSTPTPAQRYNNVQPRSATPPTQPREVTPRSTPVQPRTVEPRSAPVQPRSVEPRSVPSQPRSVEPRSMPVQPRTAAPPPNVAPRQPAPQVERRAPPPRERGDDKKKDDGH